MSTPDRFGSTKRQRHVAIFSTGKTPAPSLREVSPFTGDDPAPPKRQRARVFELSSHFHCSIVGTCLTTAEVRHLLGKLGVQGVAALSEHEVHGRGVQLASLRDFGGRLLNKTLDRKHRAFVSSFARAETAGAVLDLWADALKNGEIPGAYWAAMTHPATSDDVLRRIFEDVHMLSHLVGAANRADIRRLRELETSNAELAAKAERQQAALRQATVSRDAIIADLQRSLAAALARAADTGTSPDGLADAHRMAPDVDFEEHYGERLAKLARHSERLEVRVERQAIDVAKERECRKAAEVKVRELEAECAALEAQLGLLTPDARFANSLSLAGSTILYVGGRAHHIARLRSSAEVVGGVFLHHDGGEECSGRLISPMVARADIVVFPVDCVSHDAVGIVKRTCRQLGKRYVPLRSSGLGSFISALRTFEEARRVESRVAAAE